MYIVEIVNKRSGRQVKFVGYFKTADEAVKKCEEIEARCKRGETATYGPSPYQEVDNLFKDKTFRDRANGPIDKLGPIPPYNEEQ